MSGVISYPRTDGSKRLDREIAYLEMLIMGLGFNVSLHQVNDLLALANAIGWHNLPPKLRSKLFWLLRQAQMKLAQEAVYIDEETYHQAEPMRIELMDWIDRQESTWLTLEDKQDREPFALAGVFMRLAWVDTHLQTHTYQRKYQPQTESFEKARQKAPQAGYFIGLYEFKNQQESRLSLINRLYQASLQTSQPLADTDSYFTSFDCAEEAGTDVKHYAQLFGLAYQATSGYALVAVDMQRLKELLTVQVTPRNDHTAAVPLVEFITSKPCFMAELIIKGVVKVLQEFDVEG